MNYILEIFYTLTESLILFLFLVKIYERVKINYLKATVIVILHTTFITFLNLFWGTFSAGMIYYPIVIIFTTILYNYIIKESVITVFVFTLLGFALSMLCDLSTIPIILFVTQQDASVIFSNSIYRTIGALLSRTEFFLIAILFISKYLKKMTNIFLKIDRKYNLAAIFVICMISFLVLTANNFYKYTHMFQKSIELYITMVAIGIIIFSVVIIGILSRTFSLMQKDIEWKYKESVMEQQTLYLNNINEVIRTLRAQRHDFKHHVGCLYGLLQRGENEEAKAYIKELTEEVIKYDQLIHIENPILASILNVKLLRAMDEGIKVDTHIEVPKEIGFENINISRIIGNIMDNAIEACEQTPQKYIDISLHIKNNNLIIKLVNSKSNQVANQIGEDGTYHTTKTTDPENHGFGLSNIKQIVQKNRGIVKMDECDEKFEISIAIPVH